MDLKTKVDFKKHYQKLEVTYQLKFVVLKFTQTKYLSSSLNYIIINKC